MFPEITLARTTFAFVSSLGLCYGPQVEEARSDEIRDTPGYEVWSNW